MTKAEKAKNLRYKKAIVSQLNFEKITSQLYDISSVCEEYQYYFSGDDDTLSNCKHAIGFGPQHDKAIYAFCEKRSDVAKIKFLIVSRKNKCNAWEKRSDEGNA